MNNQIYVVKSSKNKNRNICIVLIVACLILVFFLILIPIVIVTRRKQFSSVKTTTDLRVVNSVIPSNTEHQILKPSNPSIIDKIINQKNFLIYKDFN